MQQFIEKFLFAFQGIGMRYVFMTSAAFIVFYVLLKKPMQWRKIQAKLPKLSDFGRDIAYSILSIAIFAVVSSFTFVILAPYSNLYSDPNQYGVWYVAFSFVWMFFFHDAYFYWIHRLMHHPKMFKYVHLVHHQSHNPSPFTAYAFHPIEAFLEAIIVTIFAFTIPLHRSHIIVYMLFQIIYNVYGHLGYEILPKGFNYNWLGRYFNTSVAHNMHHKYAVKNYGLWTTIWDRAFGTMHEKYDETYDKIGKES
jgi:Delta7-sterol 5-desaturase